MIVILRILSVASVLALCLEQGALAQDRVQSAQGAGTIEPRPREFSQWFSNVERPAEVLVDGADGSVGVVMAAGADGQIKQCLVTQSSGFGSLDAFTCQVVMDRARFEPARDESGRKVPGSVFRRIEWRSAVTDPTSRILSAEETTALAQSGRCPHGLAQRVFPDGPGILYAKVPESVRLRRKENLVGVSALIGCDGRVKECEVIASSDNAILDQTACDDLSDRSRFYPARNEAGELKEARTQLQVRYRQ